MNRNPIKALIALLVLLMLGGVLLPQVSAQEDTPTPSPEAEKPPPEIPISGGGPTWTPRNQCDRFGGRSSTDRARSCAGDPGHYRRPDKRLWH